MDWQQCRGVLKGRVVDRQSRTQRKAEPDAATARRRRWIEAVTRDAFKHSAEFAQYGKNNSELHKRRLVDFFYIVAGDEVSVHRLFDRLRWGGLCVFISNDAKDVAKMAQRLEETGCYVFEKRTACAWEGWFGLPIPWVSRKVHYLVARKVMLLRQGETTDRFTYHVQLVKKKEYGDRYVVMKQVPTLERVVARLREKFPDCDGRMLEQRARKFTDKIFPVFLSREAAMLFIIQRDLPKKYAAHMPQQLGVEYKTYDGKQYVHTLYQNWLRNGGEPISQIEFACQSAELLAALHDQVNVMHLDLRLDNFVITSAGVGFVDFGSAVRGGEVFSEQSLLSTLFEEMMKTSQIQRMLGSMSGRGLITSRQIVESHQKIDKAVDFFFLAVQINSPHSNPDFRDLVKYDKKSEEARRLKELTDAILRPSDPKHPRFTSARDILLGIQEIQRELSAVKSGKGEAAAEGNLSAESSPGVITPRPPK